MSFSFRYLQFLKNTGQIYQSRLLRKAEVEFRYSSDRAKVKKIYKTHGDFILINIFKAKSIKNDVGLLEAIIDETIERTILTPNNYEYDIEDCCEHLILWTLDNLTVSKAKKYLINKLNITKDFIIWENSVQNRSIDNVKHFQIIVKK